MQSRQLSIPSLEGLLDSPLPSGARLWVFGFSKPLSPLDQERVRERLNQFLPQWQSHGEPVIAGYELVGDRFVLISAHCPTGVSGCSVDSGFRVFKELREEGLDGLNRGLIFHRDTDDRIQSVPFQDFQGLVDRGEVGPNTAVFDTTLESLDQFRRGAFEVPFQQSWHARSFPLP